MKKKYFLFASVLAMLMGVACHEGANKSKPVNESSPGTYAFDASFLAKHTRDLVELKDSSGESRILLSPEFQGRVMTSTSMGDSGTSFGWINYDLLASGEKKKQFNPVGGEERFWLGPEGGQYALYFKKNDSFDIDHWQVPPLIDVEPYPISQQANHAVTFSKEAVLTNYSGTAFNIRIDRTVSLLSRQELETQIGVSVPAGVHWVAYQSDNQLTNTGNTNWSQEAGLVSIWLLSMMTPSEETTVIIPFHPGPDARGLITDDYFGAIPPERLEVKDSVLFFTCDGKKRSKLGLSPRIAKGIAGSFDFRRNILTLLVFPVDDGQPYVNSKWEMQKEPYRGDVVNSYNDGPLEDGSQMGPFYEIESSSPALQLNKGASYHYIQSVSHLQGDYPSLRKIALDVLGVDLDQVRK